MKILYAIVLCTLLSVGLLPSAGKEQAAPSISIQDVLRAHNVPHDPNALAAYASEAWIVEPIEGRPDGKSHNFFVQRRSVFVRGDSFRYDTVVFTGPIFEGPTFKRPVFKGPVIETYVSDGAVCSRSISEPDRPVKTQRRIAEPQFKLIESQVWRFGLIPYLRRLSAPRTEATYLGRTESGDDKFEIKTSSGAWTLFADQLGLIQKVETGRGTIVFSDYRSVEGVQLPFNERVLLDGKPFYELAFDKISLKLEIDRDFFNSSE